REDEPEPGLVVEVEDLVAAFGSQADHGMQPRELVWEWWSRAGARSDDRRGEAREKEGPGLVRVQSFAKVSVAGRPSLQVVREGGDDRALAEQEASLQQQRGLVVEDVAPPVADD